MESTSTGFLETLHPKIVHFPIAFLFGAGICYLLHFFIKGQRLDRFGFYLHVAGLLGCVAAILSGDYAESAMVQTREIHHIVEEHEFQGMVTAWAFGLLAVWAFLRSKTKFMIERIVFTVVFVLGLGWLTIAADHGGQLVYEQGAGVEPMRKHLIEQRDLEQRDGAPIESEDD